MLAWLRLLRLSNAPTALADIWMGYAVVTGSFAPPWLFAMLSIASLALYHGGMVLNDAVDAEQDRAERSNRPVASGKIQQSTAFRIAYVMLAIGVGLAAIVAWHKNTVTPLLISLLLSFAIIAYNSRLKWTVVGPVLMGICRSLNVLLGMSAAVSFVSSVAIAPGVFAYIAGLTLFARDEAIFDGGNRRALALGAMVSILGIGWLALGPWLVATLPRPAAEPSGWWLLWGVVALMIGRGFAAAVLSPSSQTVQRAIVIALQGIIIIDASLAAAYAGPFYGLAVLALLPVTMLLKRVIPLT